MLIIIVYLCYNIWQLIAPVHKADLKMNILFHLFSFFAIFLHPLQFIGMPKIKLNPQSAQGPMLGFIFQIERALWWLSQTGTDGQISIETDDDLVVRLKEDPSLSTIYEQDKSAVLSQKNPFSNKSKDLWKTLHIWTKNVQSGLIDLSNSRLLLVTNKQVGSCLMKNILHCKEERATFVSKIDQLLQGGLTSANKEVKEYAELVNTLEEEQKYALFQNIVLMDIAYSHDRKEVKKAIKDHLHVGDAIPFNSIYNELLGWLTDLIIAKWVSGQQATLKGSELNNYFSAAQAKHLAKPFMEKTKELLPVADNIRGAHKGENFVRQLDWIGLEEEDKINAIDDFIRARWERTRFAKEGNIPCKKDFENMDEDLYERWDNLRKPMARHCKTADDKAEKGHDLYWSVMNHKAKLASYDTEQYYTTKGAYHLMANVFRLGWHFDWEGLKKDNHED